MMAPEQFSQPAHRASIGEHKRKLQCINAHSSEAKKPAEPSTTTSGARSNTAERTTEPSGKTPATVVGCMRRCSMCSALTSSMIELSDISDTACCIKCIPGFWKAEYETRCKINATHKISVIPSAQDIRGQSVIHSHAHTPLPQGLHKIHPSISIPHRMTSPTDTTTSQKMNSPTESELHPSSSAFTHNTNRSTPTTGTAATTPADSSVPCSPAAPHCFQQGKAESTSEPATPAVVNTLQDSKTSPAGEAPGATAASTQLMQASGPTTALEACTPNSKLQRASLGHSLIESEHAAAPAAAVAATTSFHIPLQPHNQVVSQGRMCFWDSPVRDYILNRSAPVVEVMMDDNDDGCLLTVRLGSAAVMLHSAVKLWRAGMAWPS